MDGVGVLLEDTPEAQSAEAEMFADLLRDALLTHFNGTVRPVHRVAVGRLLRGGSAFALVAALDAVRRPPAAVRGECRTADAKPGEEEYCVLRGRARSLARTRRQRP